MNVPTFYYACPYPLYVEEGGWSMKRVITLSLALDYLFAGHCPCPLTDADCRCPLPRWPRWDKPRLPHLPEDKRCSLTDADCRCPLPRWARFFYRWDRLRFPHFCECTFFIKSFDSIVVSCSPFASISCSFFASICLTRFVWLACLEGCDSVKL